jgi:two-component system, cell cycle sensor histidine kinase and response regulator CckA
VDESGGIIQLVGDAAGQLTQGGHLFAVHQLCLQAPEQMVRELSREILEQKGYKVVVATNGKDGLGLCEELSDRIDLIITDVVMPEMSGRELAEKVAASRPETKVLYMSGYTDDAVVRHGILEEHTAFIQKPFLPDSFAVKVREALDQPTQR